MLDARAVFSALVLALLASGPLAGGPATPSPAQAMKDEDESYVQITSVSIEPSTIHIAGKPDEATVTVQILVHGKVPPDSKARVDVGTYSTDPPGIKVYYPKENETVRLDKPLVAVRLAVQTTPETVAGKVVVAATIHEVTGVRRIKEPQSDEDWRAEVTIADP